MCRFERLPIWLMRVERTGQIDCCSCISRLRFPNAAFHCCCGSGTMLRTGIPTDAVAAVCGDPLTEKTQASPTPNSHDLYHHVFGLVRHPTPNNVPYKVPHEGMNSEFTQERVTSRFLFLAEASLLPLSNTRFRVRFRFRGHSRGARTQRKISILPCRNHAPKNET